MNALPALPISGDKLAHVLVGALDMREKETGAHSKRVACHTLVLAKQFFDDPAVLAQIYWGALLHDIGKIGIPDAVLLKDGPLSAADWEAMRRHPELGYELLTDMPGFETAAQLVLFHEERFDGSGYPGGAAGNAIPLPARLFAVIDTLDAIVSDRPYRAGRSFDIARAEIIKQSGQQFDPVAVRSFLAAEVELRHMVAIQCGPQVTLDQALGTSASSPHKDNPRHASEEKDMTYVFSRTLAIPFEDAVARVTDALKAEGFGILTDIDVAETLKKKIAVDYPRYRILGACNPKMAYEALKLEDKVGTMLPCNVVVRDAGDGRTEVAAIDPVASMQAIDNPALLQVAQTVRTLLEKAVQRI